MPSLAPVVSQCAPPPADAPRRLLVANLFEEGCFHDDMREGTRQTYFSCGQFNNVLASLMHALVLSRLLCRTLVLPGFFIRFGAHCTATRRAHRPTPSRAPRPRATSRPALPQARG